MRKNYILVAILIFGLLMIPLVHLIMPFFISSEPAFVPAGGGSGSIMAATNVYQQIIPYVLAYLFAPIFVISALLMLRKNKKSQQYYKN